LSNHSEIENYFNKLEYLWGDFLDILPIGILIFDSRWRIKSVNKNFIDLILTSLKAQDLINKNLINNKYFENSLPESDILELEKGKCFETVINNDQSVNNRIKVALKGNPIFTDGKFAGGILIAEDFRITEDEPKKELKEYQSIVSASSDATFKINLHGNITFWTDSAANYFDVQKEDILEKFIGELLPKLDKVYFEKIKNNLISNQSWISKFKYVKEKKSFLTSIEIVLTEDENNLIVYCNYINESQQRLKKQNKKKFSFLKRQS
jgi:PAS domain-containing protein